MVEYSGGFISCIINRGDHILDKKRYNVTRLLMLLNCGFAMVWERMKFQELDDEEDLSNEAKIRKFREKFSNCKCDVSLNIKDKLFFTNFSKNPDWNYIEIKLNEQKRRYDINEVLLAMNEGEVIKRSNLKYSQLIRSLRNSLGHGGIHPLSPQQSSNFKMKTFSEKRLHEHSRETIDKVFFVSKTGKETAHNSKGLTIIVMSVDAVHLFWEDWRDLLLKNEVFSYLDLDNAV